ncbi:MAG: hypothetical protein QM747_16955 [Nocardioides sp.]
MDGKDELLITIKTSPASDSWGFVGVVAVGEVEAYRTIRASATPAESLATTQQLLAGVLGSLMAGQEWSSAQTEFGHAPRRTELEFGLQAQPVDDGLEGQDRQPD